MGSEAASPETQRTLEGSEWRYQSLIENSTIGLYRTTPQGRILLANPTLLEMLGYDSIEDLASRDLEHEGYEPGYPRREFRERIEREGVVRGLESAWKRKDGTTIFVRESARLVRDEGGKPLYYEGAVENITEAKQAERALARERSILRTIIDSLPDNVFIKSADGRIILDNAAHRKFLGGASLKDVVGKTDRDFFSRELADAYMEDERRIVESGQPLLNYEEPSVGPDGRPRWLLTTKVPVRDPRGRVSALVGINRDITGQKEAEGALRESEDKFKYVFDHSPVGKSITLPTGEIMVNEAFGAMLGYAAAELANRRWQDLTPPADVPVTEAAIARLLSGEKERIRFEKRYLHKDGSIRWADVSTALRRDGQGRPLYFMTSVIDITERKRAEQVLRESEERFRRVFEDSPLGMVLTDREMRFIRVNPAFCRMLEYSETELGALSFVDITHPDHRAQDRAGVEELWQGKRDVYRTIKRYLTKSGDIRWGNISASILRDQEGRPANSLALIEDITDQKKAEDELHSLSLRQEAILTAVPDIIMEVDNAKVYVWANAAGREFFGDDVVGHEAASYFEGEQDTYTRVAPIFRGSTDLIYVESWQRRRDGEKRILGWWCVSLRDADGRVTGALSSARDVTEHKRAELALRESEAKYRDLIENINDVIYTVDPEGRILYISQAAEGIFGYAPPELVGQDFFGFILPEDRPRILEAWADVLQEQLYPSEYRVRARDGSVRWVRTSSRPMLAPGGQLVAITGSLFDVTDRKSAEDDLERHRLHLEELVLERTAELEQARHRLEQVLQAAGEGIFGLDPMGQITFINEAATRMLGRTPDELLGRRAHDVLHPVSPSGQPFAEEDCPIMRTVRTGELHAQSGMSLSRKDGSPIYVDLISSPLVEKKPGTGAVVALHDVTVQRLIEEEKKKYTEDLERFNRSMVDREKRIMEMKEEINRLCQELGREPRYPVIWR